MSGSEPRIRRALLSVSDKRGLVELGQALTGHGVELLSTGGSARALREAGLEVMDVSGYTGFPEIMGGRVKTLHPKIHGGILARAGVDDAVAADHGLPPIDLVAVNLYPFADTVADPDCSWADAIENIDIGGPTLVRAAAKNHARVTVLCDPDDYATVIATLPAAPDEALRRRLATRAFAHTAKYDGQISEWLSARTDIDTGIDEPGLPPRLSLNLDRAAALRYGENPHQAAGLYVEREAPRAGLAGAQPLQGKPLSYNNLLDADAAWSAVAGLGEAPACVIIKHTNPCGAARGESPEAAYRKALACDPTSAFGGILAFNRELDGATAEAISRQFAEVVLAPGFSDAAREVLSAKKNLRLIAPGDPARGCYELRRIDGGWLVQQPDALAWDRDAMQVVTKRTPDEREWRDLAFCWSVVAAVRSNAIVLARDEATLGIGAGQMSRVDSARIATRKAAEQGLALDGAVLASDAFFPFADGVETAAEAGVKAIVQPGGSKRDDEVIEAADRHGIAMVFTGRRHFRH
ncbi:bifunctional phosphoribosylaminoimidazolecarboxamide formyltransferase/IMP cyclohydrolase [Wenzhouxiangella sp. XN79A]|uniref:bifunctional phosphoribosylaminoimidazolecarboxamide formyltransferase/IMP cyclohydrolase n=1 Tax=Wenzhouxiangella sp. XN79A TaxID=2724193 RepID=UPI00144A8FD8|nr:bifunctional phosphoribosylaminoimidazolecarboxamide formyltransferase/IMP cyclohydrolase [Wenzhouxiangella sp. XN79A]